MYQFHTSLIQLLTYPRVGTIVIFDTDKLGKPAVSGVFFYLRCDKYQVIWPVGAITIIPNVSIYGCNHFYQMRRRNTPNTRVNKRAGVLPHLSQKNQSSESALPNVCV
jgi:hypothetical protein